MIILYQRDIPGISEYSRFKKLTIFLKALLSPCIIAMLLFLFFPEKGIAITNNSDIGSRQAGLAYAGVTLSDAWSVYHNQAGLANIKSHLISLHHDSKFNISGLGTKALAIIIPNKTGTLGLSLFSFGNSGYRENKINLALGKKFGEKFSTGIQISYFNIELGDNYGNANNIIFEGGILFEASETITIGAHIYNPLKSKINNLTTDRIPTTMKLGVGIIMGSNVLICSETEKIFDQKPIFKTGIEFNHKDILFLRTGITTNPIQNCFGGGYSYKNISTDIAFIKHQLLGYSLKFTCTYTFKRK